mgnify:CR=1 FL=1
MEKKQALENLTKQLEKLKKFILTSEIILLKNGLTLVVFQYLVYSIGIKKNTLLKKVNSGILFYMRLFMQWEEFIPVHLNILNMYIIQKKLVI